MNSPLHRQTGVALVVSLLMLLLLTALALTAASNSSLQQRMASNAQEQNNAFQAAESGLARWIDRFTRKEAMPTGNENIGSAIIEPPVVSIQANCIEGSIGEGGGSTFVFDCYHVTSSAETTNTGGRARHQMGYLTRLGQSQ